ncbi:protein kinase domain-containing protein [Ditylenchus destructor]|uniref:cyclin-dependent kinase n=1 Tax=Ditylenchus destructor TaxID=166010 RepID=A0AAD4RB05_9BILA|nr:protein kinase domain-containing protein [Ditylenchus destructor]
MASAVWTKLTTHISTWFGDEKRHGVHNGESQLRPSCSLSMLNQKSLRIRVVRSSKSSENLHKIQQMGQSRTRTATETTYDYPADERRASHESPVSAPRKKSFSGSTFFNNFRIKKLHKQSKTSTASTPSTSSAAMASMTIGTKTSDADSNPNSCSTTRSHFSGKSKKKKSSDVDSRFSGPQKGGMLSEPFTPPLVSNGGNVLYHTLPMSLSWHNNLNANNITAAGMAMMPNGVGHQANGVPDSHAIYPVAYPPTTILSFNNYGESPSAMEQNNGNVKDSGSQPPEQNGNRLVDWFGGGRSRSKPKRSRSVGAVQHKDYSVKVAVNAQNHNGHARGGEGDLNSATSTMTRTTTISGGFRTPQSMAAYKCNPQYIDANFLAFGHKDSQTPVMSSDLMFRRLEKLGEGSYATVWKSENRMDGSIVALKEIKLQPQEGLPFTAIREVSLLRGLKHANIIRLHQIIHQPHSLILVFEYMKTDLSKYMEYQRHGLEPFRVKVFLFQLLRGLAFCHDRKILHRDLKPQNLLVSDEGELKLADFGLARAKSVPCRTFSHDVVTLWYRPPDVLLGSTHYSTSLDMWGVGCIMAEMCSGVALFPGINDVVDQLDRIFSIRGVPDLEKWPEVKDLPNYATFHFTQYSELEWSQVDTQLGRLPDDGDLLLSTFLQLNPVDRISAKDAMAHQYFKSLPSAVHTLHPTQSILQALQTRI